MTQIITISATKFPFIGSLKMQGCKEHVRFRRYGRVKHQANIKEQPQYNVARNSYMMYVHLRFRGLEENTKVQVPRFAIITGRLFSNVARIEWCLSTRAPTY